MTKYNSNATGKSYYIVYMHTFALTYYLCCLFLLVFFPNTMGVGVRKGMTVLYRLFFAYVCMYVLYVM